MLSRNQIKFIASLQQKKYRKQHGLFVAEGPKIVKELLESHFKVEAVYALPSFAEAPSNQTLLKYTEIHLISEKDLQRISGLKTPNEVLALVKIPQLTSDCKNLFDDLLIYLDNLQDPGNLGTILRTADWFGIKNIVCSPDTVEVYSPKIVQASMGSIIRVNIMYKKLDSLLEGSVKKIPVYATMLNGKNIYKTNLQTPGLIIIGNESRGISDEILPFIDHQITIPSIQKTNGPESLNASVAASLVISEFRRHHF